MVHVHYCKVNATVELLIAVDCTRSLLNMYLIETLWNESEVTCIMSYIEMFIG
jgi:hypothetical protein